MIPLLIAFSVLFVGGSAPLASSPQRGHRPIITTAADWRAALGSLPAFGDGNQTIQLSATRYAVMNGDTLPRAGGAWAHNTVAIVEDGKAHLVQPGSATLPGSLSYQMVPDGPNGTFRWLGGGFAAFNRMYAISTRVHPVAAWPGFAVDDVDLSLFDVSSEPRYVRSFPLPASEFVQWGASLYYDAGSATVYLFGASKEATDGWTGHDVYVARTPLGSIEKRASWAYWTGGTWGPSAPSPVLRAAVNGGTGPSFAAWRDASGWHLTDRRGGVWGTTVTRFTTRTFGPAPWSELDLEVALPEGAYGVWDHWSVPNAPSGKRLLSYNRQDQEVAFTEVS